MKESESESVRINKWENPFFWAFYVRIGWSQNLSEKNCVQNMKCQNCLDSDTPAAMLCYYWPSPGRRRRANCIFHFYLFALEFCKQKTWHKLCCMGTCLELLLCTLLTVYEDASDSYNILKLHSREKRKKKSRRNIGELVPKVPLFVYPGIQKQHHIGI